MPLCAQWTLNVPHCPTSGCRTVRTAMRNFLTWV
ncbi:gp19.2 [Escherichia phage BA14]|uniref:Gp19.2 n=1 Tax=Escherichia phage BA14 TaxID=532074 RepID=B3VCS2_9CAUD|nr:gp19.2 [Escherichia phage BA14]ACF15777.1 gp19.2 [Escherichia phage BA14]